ncbi:tRNA (guanosine(46)-N7)-methyltransferase TrmB [Helcobacillus massiliensis]|uniref:tRNA (guanine-N(7)-)-methyltransferase n=1 Tax=Helcobacillus massiliensis TaxID=521392 RepID=A0A839QUV9_9MICO|nr:tRNA (guanosine(46)-N7)-methyltransferase TrmB [Helcobacillus massiliensis]MBB3023428.1 tRNA (guanine-N7-)-methyltransferase [Helcobacillus massiliensis]MCT1557970.1 tRNA (guanosine(46)-N7)-methyltransferase TrmB [Helcobacillus massiliensis]MCT2037052.1 tRNA (guanosine(46)-N7)-methyltransferase TrmB [Helcobacillus massiliensis]MCT2332826.1 tRNA (guanosine(46)-N7)-methyltransferase TrmB [Helcobacillus massiliensis]
MPEQTPTENSGRTRSAAASRPRREIVSFVRRGRRLTEEQTEAWDAHHEQYMLDVPQGERDTLIHPDVRLDPVKLFGNDNPLIIEIGSGQGDNIAQAAADMPDHNFLAFEVWGPGNAQTVVHLQRLGLPQNLRILEFDAEHSLPGLLPESSVEEVWIFFADPWHKTKHHKRRLVSAGFLEELHTLLKPGGRVRTATDWADYASHQAHAFETVAARGLFTNDHPDGPRPTGSTTDEIPEDSPATGWAPRFERRVRTAFEGKALRAGRLIWDLSYSAQKPAAPAASATEDGSAASEPTTR